MCNAENVHVLREFRANCKVLVALGACAVNGGLPAQRNHLDLGRHPAGTSIDTGHGLARQPHPRRPRAAAAAQPGPSGAAR